MRNKAIVLGLALLISCSPVMGDTTSGEIVKPSLFKRCVTWIKSHLGLKLKSNKANPESRLASRQAEFITRFDVDGDGKLSSTEKTAARQALEAERITRYDTDGDGTLTATEKAAMEKERPQRLPHRGGPGMMASGTRQMPAEVLEKFDADGDGTLNETELKAAHEAREAEMLTTYDADGDGALSDTEKATMQEDRPEGPPHRGGPGMMASGTRLLSPEQREARHQALLQMYDKDGNGTLDETEKAEAKSGLQKYFSEYSPEN